MPLGAILAMLVGFYVVEFSFKIAPHNYTSHIIRPISYKMV